MASESKLMPVVPMERIREFVALQSGLMSAFQSCFPSISDWEFLLDAPKRGQVRLLGEHWVFQRHGAGLRFSNAQGIVVDVHSHVQDRDCVDAWRILQFLESACAEKYEYREDDIDASLNVHAEKGRLLRCSNNGLFRVHQDS